MQRVKWIGKAAGVAIGVADKHIPVLQDPAVHNVQGIGTQQRVFPNLEAAAPPYSA